MRAVGRGWWLIWLLGFFLGCSREKMPSPLAEQARHQWDQVAIHEKNGEFRKAVAALKEAESLYRALAEAGDPQHRERAIECLNRMGWNLAVYLGDYVSARRCLETARDLGERHLETNHKITLTSYHNLAIVSYYQNKLGEALDWNRKLLEIRLAKFGEDHGEVAATLNNLGMVNQARGELDQAILYYRRALAVKLKLHGEGHASLSSTYLNMGRSQALLGDFDAAQKNIEKSLAIRKQHLAEDHPNIGAATYILGLAHEEKGNFTRAEALISQALKIQEKAFGLEHPHLAHSLWELGKLDTLAGRTNEALVHLERAFAIMEKQFGPEDHHLAENYNLIAWHYWQTNQLDLAQTQVDKGLAVLEYQIGNPRLRGDRIDETLVRCLEGRAVIMLSKYKTDGLSSHLDHALAAIDDATRVITGKRRGIMSQQAKLTLNRGLQRLLSMGVHGALERFRLGNSAADLDRAFTYSQRSKMAVLADAIRDIRIKSFSGIPTDLLEREGRLKERVFSLNEALAAKTIGKHRTAELNRDLIDAYAQWEDFSQNLQANYPKYFQLKFGEYSRETIGLEDQLVHPNQVLLDYYLGNGLLTIFVASPESVTYKQVPLHQSGESVGGEKGFLPLEDWLGGSFSLPKSKSFLADIEKLRSSVIYSNHARFAFYGRELYKLLVAPVRDHLVGRNLLIIPGARFSHLPFELLLTEDPKTETRSWDLPFLIKDHAISYHYSTQIGSQKNRTRTPLKWAGFAPVVFGASEHESMGLGRSAAEKPSNQNHYSVQKLRSIPFSEQEVETIAAMLRDKGVGFSLFTHNRASEGNLKEVMDKATVIHLATHGFMDAESPALSRLHLAPSEGDGEDGVLHLGEFFALETRAELVVLSACDTGLGKVIPGEGILGFCRGLFYAGVASILVSNWQVNDRSTTRFMTLFYQNLLSGQSLSEALWQSKVSMIADGSKPFHWAPFILIGENEPLFPQ